MNVFPKHEFFLLLSTEDTILKKVDKQTVGGTKFFDFHSISSVLWESTVMFFCSQQKESYMGLEQNEGE